MRYFSFGPFRPLRRPGRTIADADHGVVEASCCSCAGGRYADHPLRAAPSLGEAVAFSTLIVDMPSSVQIPVEELCYFPEGNGALGRIGFEVLSVGLTFKYKQIGINP